MERTTRRAPALTLLVVLALAVSALAVSASTARADANPVGAIPKGPVSTVKTDRGQLVAVALPRQKASTGLVWRLARTVDPKVVRQLSEADVGSSVVVVFQVVGRGRAAIVFALTRGERARAFRSQTTMVVSF